MREEVDIIQWVGRCERCDCERRGRYYTVSGQV